MIIFSLLPADLDWNHCGSWNKKNLIFNKRVYNGSNKIGIIMKKRINQINWMNTKNTIKMKMKKKSLINN